MKYEKRAAGIFLTIAVLASVLASDSLSASQPGTSADPLVSKSYVDGKIAEALGRAGGGAAAPSADMESIVTDVIAQLEFLYGDKLRDNSGAVPPDINIMPETDKYVPVSAAYGQVIIGDEGCEIILRSGTAKVYSNALNGLVDGTLGAELFNGDEMQRNHIMIVPRGDGRGAEVTGSEAWFIIKGNYEIH